MPAALVSSSPPSAHLLHQSSVLQIRPSIIPILTHSNTQAFPHHEFPPNAQLSCPPRPAKRRMDDLQRRVSACYSGRPDCCVHLPHWQYLAIVAGLRLTSNPLPSSPTHLAGPTAMSLITQASSCIPQALNELCALAHGNPSWGRNGKCASPTRLSPVSCLFTASLVLERASLVVTSQPLACDVHLAAAFCVTLLSAVQH